MSSPAIRLSKSGEAPAGGSGRPGGRGLCSRARSDGATLYQLDSQASPLDTREVVMQPVITEHIEATPGVCAGRPRIAGRRVRVQDIVVWHEALGLSPDEIVSQHPEVTLADVYAALTYYHDHREEIRQQMREDGVLAASMKVQAPSKLVQKLTGRNGGDSIPSG